MEIFVQNSSIIRRVRTITISLAFLLLLQFAGTWFSSQNFLHGLTELNRFNTITDQIARGLENISASRELVEKTVKEKLDPVPQTPVFDASFQAAYTAVAQSSDAAVHHPEIRRSLEESRSSLDEMGRKGRQILRQLAVKNHRPADIEKDLLLLRQFELDASESLRRAQIALKLASDQTFTAVYGGRFLPLFVSLVFAGIFFTFVMLLGLATNRRLRVSLANLLESTDQVARGNLKVQPKVLVNDEIGRLTFSFAQMVRNLDVSVEKARRSAERTSRLQLITAEFSRALEPKAVADAVVKHGIAALKVDAAGVMVVSEDEKSLSFLSSAGHSEKFLQSWGTVPFSADLPSAEVVRTQQPMYIESRDELARRFENLRDSEIPASMALLPLLANGKSLGVLSLRFLEERKFSSEEREFILALAGLASQALHRAKLYEDAQKAVRMRDEFLSIASHELKTPITSLKLQLQLALRQVKPEQNLAPTPERLKHVFGISIGQVDRLSALVEDLLDVSRMEAGKLSYDFAEANLSEIVTEVLDRFSDALKEAHCSLSLQLDENSAVWCDRYRLEQVVINLLSNAMKYSPGQTIEVRVQGAVDSVQLTVRDSGIGIEKEKQSLIFERFERAVSTRNISGLGLGLYIARQIVLAHRGKITVESELGKGSTFTVILPRNRPAAA